jgi:hypothetical protein
VDLDDYQAGLYWFYPVPLIKVVKKYFEKGFLKTQSRLETTLYTALMLLHFTANSTGKSQNKSYFMRQVIYESNFYVFNLNVAKIRNFRRVTLVHFCK